MVGWYCNLGYGPPYTSVNNISQITWTDIKRPFPLLSVNDITYIYETYQTPNEAYLRSEELLGQGVFTVYGLPPMKSPINSSTQSMVGYLNEYYPSQFIWAPNLLKMVSSNNSNSNYIYFPSLGIIATRYKTTVAAGAMGRVSSSGDITWVKTYDNSVPLSILSWNGGDVSGRRNFAMWNSIVYKDDYKNTANWGSISVQFYDDNTKYLVIRGPDTISNIFKDAAVASEPEFTELGPEDPYEPGGYSGPGEDEPGTFDFDSDTIDLPPLPTLSAANTGFTRIYNPTLQQVQALANYLWTDESVIDTIWNHIKQYFEDPMQAIIGFNLVPCIVPDGGTEEFKLMYIGTGVNMTVAASQFVDVDCGSVVVEKVYGSALDYAPYTKVQCFLPYVGMVQLSTDEVMGRTLKIVYRIDIVSGSCVAVIKADGNVLYQYSGHCAITIPFSSADFSNYVSAAIQVAKLGVMAGAAVAGAAMESAAVAGAEQETSYTVTKVTERVNTARNPSTGRQITTDTWRKTETTTEPILQSQSKASFGGITPANIANTVGQVIGSKPIVQHSGSFSGNSGYLGVRRPYLIIEHPNMCLPQNYQKLNGYPAMMTLTLSSCKGFTRIQQIQLTGLTATNPEQAEIMELLKMGVIL